MRKKLLAAIAFMFVIGICPTNAQVPGVEWARSLGGASSTISTNTASVITDAAGNVYSAGGFNRTIDFDPGPGTYQLTSSVSGYDIYVLKLDANGDFVWAVSMGGTGSDEATGIALDATGNVYITGGYVGTADFDPSAVTFNLTGGGAFVCKLSPGGTFLWAVRQGDGSGNGIVVDASGNVLSTGSFTGTQDFDPDAVGTANLTSAGVSDIYVSKLASDGTYIWAKRMGGTTMDEGSSIATDATGNVYTTGYFSGTADFGTDNLVSAGLTEMFISKFDASGNFVWSNRIGGAGFDSSWSITTDASSNVLTTGSFTGTVDFDPGGGSFTLDDSNGRILTRSPGYSPRAHKLFKH